LQADALEALLQVFLTQKKFLRLHKFDDKFDIISLRKHQEILKLLLLLKDTESPTSLNFCYRPSIYTERLLKKLSWIHNKQITNGCSQNESNLARELHAGEKIIDLDANRFHLIPHNIEINKISLPENNPFANTFKLLNGLKQSENLYKAEPYILPLPERYNEKINNKIFPENLQQNPQEYDLNISPSTKTEKIWELLNEKMQLETKLCKTPIKELQNIKLWDENICESSIKSSEIESPHLLLLPSITEAWKKEYMQKMHSVLYSPVKNIMEKTVIESVILVLQGIPSDLFELNTEEFIFIVSIDDNYMINGSPCIFIGL